MSKFGSLIVLQCLCYLSWAQMMQKSTLDFSNAKINPETGGLCIMQEVCIDDLASLAKNLPPGLGNCQPALAPGCDCQSDDECGGGSARCVACKCKDCPESAANAGAPVLNPPLTFVIDTTKSVKPDKDSIFNLTQKVVDRIQETNTNIPSYLLVTFNDKGNDINENVEVREATDDVVRFKQEIIGLEFESYNGGRDSKERLMQGLKMAVLQSPPKSLIVVFTDNGSKNLKLKNDIMRMKKEKNIEIFIVLTPIYEGRARDKSLEVFNEVSQVFQINEVGADMFLQTVEEFEESNCL